MATILIVDDTAVDRRLAGGLLEQTPELDVCYAENGMDAMLKICNYLPDLVLTDLQMPEVDGLELMNQIATRFPDLPVVLMTAHGSENIAAQALANGAASFVPKSDLANSLVETVQHVLALSEAETRHKRLMACATKAEFEFQLENDPALIPPILELVQQMVSARSGYDHPTRVRMGVALEHALSNAMVRGNLELSRAAVPVCTSRTVAERLREEPFKERRAHLKISVAPEQVTFSIHDQGPGFDYSQVHEAGTADSLREGVGRGLVLITNFMDSVEFSDGGRKITMVKRASGSEG
ncbi:MAG: response regulator [Pirellulaceae bacterium]|jgi:CheY-like chemotaxis protein|nr:response regulator [Pirellulaceae bacterium]